MSVRRRLGPLAVNTAAALVGAALSVVVLRTTMLDSWTTGSSGATVSQTASFQKATGRIPATPPAGTTQHASHVSHAPQPKFWRSSVMPSSDTEPVTGAVPPSGFLTGPSPATVPGQQQETAPDQATWSTEIQTASLPPVTRPSPSQATRPTAKKPARVQRKKPRRRKRWQSAALKKKLAKVAPQANQRLIERFKKANVAWPPDEIAFVGIKDQRVLELHARAEGESWKPVHRYRVLAASGRAGPKLRQGDKQVPEGIYKIVYLNPQSKFHLSLRVNYPNKFDRKMAAKEGRKKLGGDIMIHGKASSAGCLAIGDDPIEELFVLAAQTGNSRPKTIIAPTDFRVHGLPKSTSGQPKWVPKLYVEIAAAMSEFKVIPKPKNLLSLFSSVFKEQ